MNFGVDYYSNTDIAGKTMTANAVANYLCKKLLLVTVSILTEAQLTKVTKNYAISLA